jgi:hypothetical protein
MKTKLTNAGPSRVIAEATDAQGIPICRLFVETVLLVSGYDVSQHVTPAEAKLAGDMLDAEIATTAALQGISKVLVSIPLNQPQLQGEDCVKMRVYTRPVNTSAFSYAPSQSIQLLN